MDFHVRILNNIYPLLLLIFVHHLLICKNAGHTVSFSASYTYQQMDVMFVNIFFYVMDNTPCVIVFLT